VASAGGAGKDFAESAGTFGAGWIDE
jgi:hypothetical protein